MNALQLRDSMIGDISALMRPHQFRRSGRIIVRLYPNGNIGTIRFQSSQKSTAERVFIRPSCEMCSIALHKVEWPDRKCCSMGGQIGKLFSSFVDCLDPRDDHWWEISDENDQKLVQSELVEIVEMHVIPWMHSHWEDNQVLDFLRAELSDGLQGPARTVTERRIEILSSLSSAAM